MNDQNETNETNDAEAIGRGPTNQCHHTECPVMREYVKAANMGPSVFFTIRDVLGLDPKYKPHRNVDAVRCAKMMSKMIKQKLCRRGMSVEGKLTWRFNDNQAYELAIKILQLEPENREFRFQ